MILKLLLIKILLIKSDKKWNNYYLYNFLIGKLKLKIKQETPPEIPTTERVIESTRNYIK